MHDPNSTMGIHTLDIYISWYTTRGIKSDYGYQHTHRDTKNNRYNPN